MYWDGVSTIVSDNLKLKSPNYEYTIVELLNDGASTVYKANRNDGKEIFLKQFREPNIHQEDWDDFVQFQHSVLKTLIQLPSSIVETNYEYFEFEGYHFHAKSLENGKDLQKKIYEDKLNFNERLHVVKTSLGILNAVHKKGVVHSDLKPHQFFIINDSSLPIGFRVKLIDFDHCIIPSLNLSRPAGTAEWRSPEHIKNGEIGYHSDVFTMGQIIYTVLTGGRQPYGHSINNDTYDQDVISRNGYIPIIDLFKGKIPVKIEPMIQSLSDIIDQMLDPDHKKRPTINEVHKIVLSAEKQPSRPKHITLESNGNSRLIVDTEIITREIVKSSFGNHSEIYNKQFELMKDNSGDWFVRGHEVPQTAKDAKGNVYNFHKTLYDGNDITNKYTKIEDGGVISVGKEAFKIRAT